jgi:hypothetical protein
MKKNLKKKKLKILKRKIKEDFVGKFGKIHRILSTISIPEKYRNN